MDTLENKILALIVDYGYVNEKTLLANKEANLFNEGYLDSFGFISLISTIEDEFDVAFDESDFSDESFMTFNGLTRCIASKL